MDETPREPADPVAELTTLLDVEQLDIDLFRGSRQPGGIGRIFGGQVIAQALQAAQRSTSPEKPAHSLHAYFMRPGDEDLPVIYRVERDFEGSSFATRRVIALQHGLPILNLAASFHRVEDGYHHRLPMPDVPPPEGLRSEHELRLAQSDAMPEQAQRFFLRAWPIEVRPTVPHNWFMPKPAEPVQSNWFRLIRPIGDNPTLHRAVLAYASDLNLLGTAMLPHGVNGMDGEMQVASLDHAVWFHEPFQADDWLLYTRDSPWSGHARGFNRGRIYARDGRLVASTAQEGLIRRRQPPRADQA